MRTLRHVEWVPCGRDGVFWRAYLLRGDGKRAPIGWVVRLRSRRYQATMYGRTNCYMATLREAAKRVVAYANNIGPGALRSL